MTDPMTPEEKDVAPLWWLSDASTQKSAITVKCSEHKELF